MTRKEARDLAFILIYQMEIQKESAQTILDIYQEENDFSGKGTDYVKSVFFGAEEKKDEIDEIISSFSQGWTVDRISKVALSIIRLAIYEIMFSEDVPDSVAINEAVELAKNYEGNETASFINGVLSTVVKNKDSKGV